MTDDKRYMSIAEFKRSGFLQEANRLFFHPHGLALEACIATEDSEPTYVMAMTAAEMDQLRAILATHDGDGDTASLVARVDESTCYGPGDGWLSGIRDARHDPEGVIFDDLDDGDAEKAATVSAERKRHEAARARLFDSTSDVEPLGWRQA